MESEEAEMLHRLRDIQTHQQVGPALLPPHRPAPCLRVRATRRCEGNKKEGVTGRGAAGTIITDVCCVPSPLPHPTGDC
jgi:hypothetical protein